MSLWDPRNVPPYPPARYTADEPEVSALLRPGTDPPDYESFALVKYHYLANQQATDGDYGLYRVDIAPTGRTRTALSPHHVRSLLRALGNTEALRWQQLDRRASQRLPLRAARGIHGFRNDADAPVSILMLFAPGAPRGPTSRASPNSPSCPTRNAQSGSSRTTTIGSRDTLGPTRRNVRSRNPLR